MGCYVFARGRTTSAVSAGHRQSIAKLAINIGAAVGAKIQTFFDVAVDAADLVGDKSVVIFRLAQLGGDRIELAAVDGVRTGCANQTRRDVGDAALAAHAAHADFTQRVAGGAELKVYPVDRIAVVIAEPGRPGRCGTAAAGNGPRPQRDGVNAGGLSAGTDGDRIVGAGAGIGPQHHRIFTVGIRPGADSNCFCLVRCCADTEHQRLLCQRLGAGTDSNGVVISSQGAVTEHQRIFTVCPGVVADNDGVALVGIGGVT